MSSYAGTRRFGGKLLAIALSLLLMLGLAMGPLAYKAEASSVRIATILEVSGTVEVKKAGGKRYFKAYKNMPLNEGDHLKTGKNASVTLKVQDRGDEATIGGDSSLYLSELRDSSGKKKSKFTLWTGTMWVKATSLVSTGDEFEIETPTAVMGVRGTTLMVSVNPVTGSSSFFIGSGVGEIQNKNSGKKDVIYPSQKLDLAAEDEEFNQGDNVTFIDLEQFLSEAGPEIIEAIIKSKSQIDKENEALLEKLRKQLEESGQSEESKRLEIASNDDFDRLAKNLSNLVGNIVKGAISKNEDAAEKLKQAVEEANKALDKKIDLEKSEPFVFTEAQKEKQEALRRLEEQRRQQQEQKKQQKEQQGQQNAELLDRLKEQKKQQEEANQQAAEVAKRKAEEEYKKKLDEASQKRFEEQKKALESTATPRPSSVPATPPPAPTPQPTPTPTPTSVLNGPGPINGDVTETVNGSNNVTFGPSASPQTQVNGNVTISGEGSGTYTLRNLKINGDLTVDVPQGSVILNSLVTVEGDTIINDVAGETFASSATHNGPIEVNDSNGTRIYLTGEASEAAVNINGGGLVELLGTYNGPVTISSSAAGVTLKISADSKITKLLIQTDDFILDAAPGSVDSIEIDDSVEQPGDLWEKLNLLKINQAAGPEALQELLDSLEYDYFSEWQLWHIILSRPDDGFDSWSEALEFIEAASAQDKPNPYQRGQEAEYGEDVEIIIEGGSEQWFEAISGVQVNGQLAEAELYRMDGHQLYLDYLLFPNGGTYQVSILANGYQDIEVYVNVLHAALPAPELTVLTLPALSGQTVKIGISSEFGNYEDWADNAELFSNNDYEQPIPIQQGMYRAQDGTLVIQGFVFQESRLYSFLIKAEGFEDAVLEVDIVDVANGFTLEVEGDRDLIIGPEEGTLELPYLSIHGDGSGTYTLRNIVIGTEDWGASYGLYEGEYEEGCENECEYEGGFLHINVPNGSVKLEETMDVRGFAEIEAVSSDPEKGFISLTEHLDFIMVLSEHDAALNFYTDKSHWFYALGIAGSGNVSINGGNFAIMTVMPESESYVEEGATGEDVDRTISLNNVVVAIMDVMDTNQIIQISESVIIGELIALIDGIQLDNRGGAVLDIRYDHNNLDTDESITGWAARIDDARSAYIDASSASQIREALLIINIRVDNLAQNMYAHKEAFLEFENFTSLIFNFLFPEAIDHDNINPIITLVESYQPERLEVRISMDISPYWWWDNIYQVQIDNNYYYDNEVVGYTQNWPHIRLPFDEFESGDGEYTIIIRSFGFEDVVIRNAAINPPQGTS